MKNRFKSWKSACMIVGIIFILVGVVMLLRTSFAEVLEDGVRVKPNSELTYYLKVSYDGADKYGVTSSEEVVANIRSGILYIEDRLPDGLTFTGFTTTADGSIGAVRRGTTYSCLGKVIDDTNEEVTDTGVWNEDHTEYTYHGLHYNDTTRTVTFQVKNLQAGCELTVGIHTMTPEKVDNPDTPEKELRRDFYNYGTVREKDLTILSNTVHVFMGEEEIARNAVTYEYTGEVPTNAPSAPNPSEYVPGTTIRVENPPQLEGYEFSGWTTADVTVTDGTFVMPEGTDGVKFTGSFTKVEVPKRTVHYQINGVVPEGYVVPLDKSYSIGEDVKVDVLKKGDVFNGYRFSGWTTENVTVSSDDDFVMPDNDVVFKGSFEEVTYQVSYQFYDTVLPENADSLLPSPKSYKPGETVTLETISDVEGYEFLGWYKETTFIMPEENVVVYGEWKVRVGTFAPTITKTKVDDGKTYYLPGDKVPFTITVTNPSDFAIANVLVKEENEHSFFKPLAPYTIMSDHVANIDQIPSQGSVELSAYYIVQPSDTGTIENIVSIKGALAENNYVLEEKDYTAKATLKVASTLKLCKQVSGVSLPNTFQFHITGNSYDTWITLEKDECKTIYLAPSTYKVQEIIPQEYQIKEVTGAITGNNQSLVIEEGRTYEITYVNEFRKKGFLHSFGRVVNKILYKEDIE